MLAPTAIEKGGPLACLAHDLHRLNFKFTADCEVPHICFRPARVKTMAEAKPLRPNT
jgi:hypothetical protein